LPILHQHLAANGEGDYRAQWLIRK